MKVNENERAMEIYFEDLSKEAQEEMLASMGLEDSGALLNTESPIAYYPLPRNVENEKQKFIQSIVLGVRPLQEDLVAGITVTKCATLGAAISEKGVERYLWFAQDNYPETPLLLNFKDENPGFDKDRLEHLSNVVNDRHLDIDINPLITIGNTDNIKLNVNYNIEHPQGSTLYLKDIVIDRTLRLENEFFFLITVAMHDDVVVIIKESDSANFLDDNEIYKIVNNPFEYVADYNSARDGYLSITNSRVIIDGKQNYEKDPYYMAVKNFEENAKKVDQDIASANEAPAD